MKQKTTKRHDELKQICKELKGGVLLGQCAISYSKWNGKCPNCAKTFLLGMSSSEFNEVAIRTPSTLTAELRNGKFYVGLVGGLYPNLVQIKIIDHLPVAHRVTIEGVTSYDSIGVGVLVLEELSTTLSERYIVELCKIIKNSELLEQSNLPMLRDQIQEMGIEIGNFEAFQRSPWRRKFFAYKVREIIQKLDDLIPELISIYKRLNNQHGIAV